MRSWTHLEGVVLFRVNGDHVAGGSSQIIQHPGLEPGQVPLQVSSHVLRCRRQRGVCCFLYRLLPLLPEPAGPGATRNQALLQSLVFVSLLLLLQNLHTDPGSV